MPVSVDPFGHLQDGREVRRATLRLPDGIKVEILEYGAILRAVDVPHGGGMICTLLGYDTLAQYEAGRAYLGATVGRVANRTAVTETTPLPLIPNDGMNQLHGGRTGLSSALWRIVDQDDGNCPRVRLTCCSESGEEGYPGNVDLTMDITITSPLSFATVIEAKTDAETPLNLTLHPYFNLSGDPARPIDDHELRLASKAFLELDYRRTPTGKVRPVEGSPFDFRRATPIGVRLDSDEPQLRLTEGYDHYWVLDPDAEIAAEVSCPRTGLRLSVRTNQKGMQFYAGDALGQSDRPLFGARSGFCLEPHGYPNAINEPRFPGIMLKPGETYRHEVEFTYGG